MAKAKSDEKAAPKGGTSSKTASSPQSRRDKLASLESRAEEGPAQPDYPAAGDLHRARVGAVGLPGLPLR